MLAALHRVARNKGAAGVYGMTVADLRANLKERWPTVRESLLTGNCTPKPVLRVEIPKPDGKGVRKPGIPTVMDRLIQQALHQVMEPIFTPGFSGSSHRNEAFPKRFFDQPGLFSLLILVRQN